MLRGRGAPLFHQQLFLKQRLVLKKENKNTTKSLNVQIDGYGENNQENKSVLMTRN